MHHNFYQHQTQVLMALQLSYFLTLFFLIFSISSSANFVTRLDSRELGLKREKLSHFRLYWHDIVSGKAPTAVMVVPPPSNSSTGFGSIMMIDDPLTLGPDPKSKLMGRAQGMYSSAAQDSVGLLMTMNFVFVEGKYNGSTIAVLGHNGVFDKVREMAVVGGSGLFRFARGYVKASTHSLDFRTGDAVVEYNCYVLHY